MTSVVLNGDAALIARPSSTKTSPGSVTIAVSSFSETPALRAAAFAAACRCEVHDLAGFDLLEKRQLARADEFHVLACLGDFVVRVRLQRRVDLRAAHGERRLVDRRQFDPARSRLRPFRPASGRSPASCAALACRHVDVIDVAARAGAEQQREIGAERLREARPRRTSDSRPSIRCRSTVSRCMANETIARGRLARARLA